MSRALHLHDLVAASGSLKDDLGNNERARRPIYGVLSLPVGCTPSMLRPALAF